jgi:hypothetical protein
MTSIDSLTLEVPDRVSPDGTGSHQRVVASDAGPFTDPDGFAWEPAGGALQTPFASAAAVNADELIGAEALRLNRPGLRPPATMRRLR